MMDGSGTASPITAFAPDTTRLSAFIRGARETPFVPSAILFSTFIGFGALTAQTGLTLFDTLLMSVFIFAMPGQVALVDEMARGASMLTAALSVAATGVRLLPMTVSLLPTMREPRVPKWMEFAVACYVSVTMWIESLRRGPFVPRHLRAAYSLGIIGWLVVGSAVAATFGFLIAKEVPTAIAAALLFMTPLYFLLGMFGSSRTLANAMPIAVGLVLGPIFHLIWPSIDLLLTGLVGGTASFLISRYVLAKASRP